MMNSRKVALIYFSPTGTTKKVLHAIAEGMGSPGPGGIDLTPPFSENEPYGSLDAACAVIGVPVYGGRVPALVAKRLSLVEGNGLPAVVVAIYGNRAYDDALLELANLAADRGFVPIACGAFIGEHSFSGGATPIAAGRPDENDIRAARNFGARVREKLESAPAIGAVPRDRIPGNVPYREHLPNAGVTPRVDAGLCTLCGVCETVCPTGTITVDDAVTLNPGNCILCHSCVKSCPEEALAFAEPGLKALAKKLMALCVNRREPEFFL